ncbi:Di-copper centre-containing protein [Russula ochroleuca]|uniref:Di-copper centre-containing protein n=1 Tax=Russula ochroleuca TaxID=152965 RepID=A0A9P5JYN9_9AGAM|nr:Di-copper centre-containing protein [Russula ochroleuca]
MFVYKLLSIALAFLWSALAVSCSYECPCIKPAIRREWRAFTTEEKAEWIRAVKCLSQLPHDPALTPSYYDDIVYIHMDLNTRIHWTGQFLPWHCWYIHAFEESLKNKCGYTGVSPYWNWTIDAPDFYESSFWKDPDPVSGIGGWGDPNADFAVPDGGFRNLHLSYPSPHTVRRNFTLFPFNAPFVLFTDHLKFGNSSFLASVIGALLATSAGDYKGFQTVLEAPEGPHTGVHAAVGADLLGSCPKNAPSNCTSGPKWAPNDPIFFMHHAMVDKVWYDWQSRDPVNMENFFGGSAQHIESVDAYNQYPNGGPPYLSLDTMIPADGLFPEVTIGDVMNTTGGFLCYVYE